MVAARRATRASAGDGPRYSIVVPTFQRRDVVSASVTALSGQRYGHGFEVIVVVDGSTDGTADELRALDVPFPLVVLEQPNRGAAAARNRGARAASGDVLLFLDDDMHAAPDLLDAHDAARAAGADAVLGHVPLHPGAPRTLLSEGAGAWAERRARRLTETGTLTREDLLTGQLSIDRALFRQLGGFDERFTHGGSFGREDTDFGQRLLDGGHTVVFAPDAVSWQYYVVGPAGYLRQWHEAGQADVQYVRKHPEHPGAVRADTRWSRFLWRPLARTPVASSLVAAVARRAATALAAGAGPRPLATKVFFKVRDLEYWRGVERAGGVPAPRPVRVLCYHSLSDLGGTPVVEDYGTPVPTFRHQLRRLRRAGFHFVSLEEVLRCLEGRGGLPRRAVLVTFDDCFADLAGGVPVLREEEVPAVAFAVSGLVGRHNTWDVAIGAPPLPLADVDGLLRLAAAGVTIGAHGRTHRPLPTLDHREMRSETDGAADELEAIGLPRPTVFAYPHGAADAAARRSVAEAGMRAAFTVTPGVVPPRATDPYGLPRIEVLRRDGDGARFLAKVALARPVPRAVRWPSDVARRGCGKIRAGFG